MLRQERPIDESVFYGWRSVLKSEGLGFPGALVRSKSSEDVEGFVEFNRGRYVGASLEGYQRIQAGTLENLPPSGQYEFRILFAPSVYLFSIWLRREDGDGFADDHFFVVPPGPVPGEPHGDFRSMNEAIFERFLNAQKMMDSQEGNGPDDHGRGEKFNRGDRFKLLDGLAEG